jgi:SAM-dependent methyltransferase
VPLSIWNGMEDCLQTIVERRPTSVLDAGIGFGLWGALLRQYLDVWSGRIQPEQWTATIDGIEIDERRVQPHARQLYTDIYIGDIRDLVPRCATARTYDVILFGDVIEHLEKPDGMAVLDTASTLAAQLVVVRIPLGDGWRREGREAPDHHRSQWYAEDFARYPCTVRQYDFCGIPYGLVAIDAGVARVEQRLERLARRLEGLAGPC